MGLHFWGLYTPDHFVSGLLSRKFVFPENRAASFLVSNGVHLASEYIEKKIHPQSGKQLESIQNQVGDILAFALGWSLADIDGGVWRRAFETRPHLVTALKLIFAVNVFLSIGREIWPRSFWFSPAYASNMINGESSIAPDMLID